MTHREEPVDVLVIGAGFGGLATALELAERGRSVELAEALNYPGGCASTFTRGGHSYESGATLTSGFAPGQLFRRWTDRHGLELRIEALDPVIEQRGPGGSLPLGPSRSELESHFLGLAGAPVEGLKRYFDLARRVSNLVWELLEHPELLPPLDAGACLGHLRRLPRSCPILPILGKSLHRVLTRYGIADWAPLRNHLEALCQITVQCGVGEAEAAFAMATAEYPHRGVAHLHGGLGTLARALLGAIEGLGGRATLSNRIRSLERRGEFWVAQGRRGPIRSRRVVLNLLPGAVSSLLEAGGPLGTNEQTALARLARLDRRLEDAWGACMLYRRVLPPEGASDRGLHLQLVDDPHRPLRDGNHVFCSISSAEADASVGTSRGARSMTVSTHVHRSEFDGGSPKEIATRIDAIHDRMRATIEARAPEWTRGQVSEFTASPRTFERFTGRPLGLVGGPPKKAGIRTWLQWGGQEPIRGLHLCGDTMFPGQSTLATALGGVRLAQRLDRKLGGRRTVAHSPAK